MTEALKLKRLLAFTEVTLWVLVVMATSGAEESCAVTNTVALLVRVPFVTVTVMLDLEPAAVLGAVSVRTCRLVPLRVSGHVLLCSGAI